MLTTRLWMGCLLIALAMLLLVEGRWLTPWYPTLFAVGALASLLACRELLQLFDPAVRPSVSLTRFSVGVLISLNWFLPALAVAKVTLSIRIDSWHILLLGFVLLTMLAICREIVRFRGPDRIAERLGLGIFVLFYLGLLPSFLLQLRWLGAAKFSDPVAAAMPFALAVFVPKIGDIGAYFTGKFLTGKILGRSPMTPLLSPKKTWQGFIGGMFAAVGTTIGFNQIAPVIPGGIFGEIAFGLSVGIAGVIGDLAESLLKRDANKKDASKSIPGFGGVLDVLDSILFAAPVVYLWFVLV